MSVLVSNRALLLVRTPFQAWLAQQVLKVENIKSYDILYFTQNDSNEDRYYYSLLAAKASLARYLFIPAYRFDVLNHLGFYFKSFSWRGQGPYSVVLLASINAPVINSLAIKHGSGKIITFDDGIANILPSGTYHQDNVTLRTRFYRYFIGAINLKVFKKKINKHYSIYPGFNNIICTSRVNYLRGWHRDCGLNHKNSSVVSYFIGQPFEEALTSEQVRVLEESLISLNIDYYVPHPRERSYLKIGAELIDKKGKIAEDAILQHSNGRAIHIVSWYSTTIFNFASVADKSTVLLLGSSSNFSEMQEMALKVGCNVVKI